VIGFMEANETDGFSGSTGTGFETVDDFNIERRLVIIIITDSKGNFIPETHSFADCFRSCFLCPHIGSKKRHLGYASSIHQINSGKSLLASRNLSCCY